jgi:hypothetical protein
MASGEKPAVIKNTSPFEEVLDDVCGKLKDRQVRNSILRIHDMEDRLTALEEELGVFLLQKDTNKAG